MKSDTLICIWILLSPIGIIEVTTPRKWISLFFMSSLHNYWPPSTWKLLVHNPSCEVEWCEKHVIKLLKLRKKKISWNLKTKCVTDTNWQIGFRVWRIILVITGWTHKRQKFKLISIKLLGILKFFFTRNRVFEHKEVVSNLDVCSNGLGKMWASYIFRFTTRILTSTIMKISKTSFT